MKRSVWRRSFRPSPRPPSWFQGGPFHTQSCYKWSSLPVECSRCLESFTTLPLVCCSCPNLFKASSCYQIQNLFTKENQWRWWRRTLKRTFWNRAGPPLEQLGPSEGLIPQRLHWSKSEAWTRRCVSGNVPEPCFGAEADCVHDWSTQCFGKWFVCDKGQNPRFYHCSIGSHNHWSVIRFWCPLWTCQGLDGGQHGHPVRAAHFLPIFPHKSRPLSGRIVR